MTRPNIPKRLLLTIACLALVTLSLFAAPPHEITTSPDSQFAALAGSLARNGATFDQVFRELCRTVLTNTQQSAKLHLDDQVRAMFGGLWLWTRAGGVPAFQGQNDKALHFIGGGAFEGYWDVGRKAGIRKEEIDRTDTNNFFDLDDLAATLMGSRWVDLATGTTPERGRRWVELWATGRYTLSRSLPKLAFGHMPPGQDAPPEKIKAVEAAVSAGMNLPDDPK